MLLLILIYLTFIGIGLPSSLLGAAWPSMYVELAVPDSYAGIASIVMMAGTVTASVYCGKLLKRFNTGVLVFAGTLVMAASTVGFGLTGRFVFLCAAAVPLGFGVGIIDTALNNYAALNYQARHMNWLHCFWGAGATAGPVILSFGMRRFDSWRPGYYMVGGILFALTLALMFTLPLWKKAAGTSAPVTAAEHEKVTYREVFRLPGIKRALAACCFYCSLESAAGLWGSSYLVFAKGVPAESAARYISLFFLGITAGRLLSGFLTMKLDNLRLTRLGYIAVALGITLTVLPLGDISYLTGFVLIGMGCAPVFPSILHDTPARFGGKYSSLVIGLEMGGAYVVATVISSLFGAAAARAGYGILPPFLALLLAGMAASIETGKKIGVKARNF